MGLLGISKGAAQRAMDRQHIEIDAGITWLENRLSESGQPLNEHVQFPKSRLPGYLRQLIEVADSRGTEPW